MRGVVTMATTTLMKHRSPHFVVFLNKLHSITNNFVVMLTSF
jgi:hypothetical protein